MFNNIDWRQLRNLIFRPFNLYPKSALITTISRFINTNQSSENVDFEMFVATDSIDFPFDFQ